MQFAKESLSRDVVMQIQSRKGKMVICNWKICWYDKQTIWECLFTADLIEFLEQERILVVETQSN